MALDGVTIVIHYTNVHVQVTVRILCVGSSHHSNINFQSQIVGR